jgi:hypothetical protein
VSEVDLSTPSDEAEDYIGLFAMYPDGSAEWTQQTIEKIQDALDAADDTGTPVNGPGGDQYESDENVLSEFTEEEQAAYQWYEEKIDNWDQTVADWRQSVGEDLNNIHHEPYQDSTHYTLHGSHFFQPPDVKEYDGGANPDAKLAVSTEAIEFLCDQLDKVSWNGGGALWDAQELVSDVDLKPGRFAMAEIMRQLIVGGVKETGLRGDTLQMLQTAHEALFTLKQSLRTMAREYDTAEEFNKLDAEKLGQALGDAWDRIDALKNYGETSSED